MLQFKYILEKINDSNFLDEPFKFIYIEDFLSDEHFNEIVCDPSIVFNRTRSTEDLIKLLEFKDYSPVPFPGCTTNTREYIKWFNERNVASPSHTHGLIEGFGLAFRLKKYYNRTMKELIEFLNSDVFLNTLMKKFNKTGKTRVETAIQKYLTGYEISPHPDIRKKCLTYMLNINTTPQSEDADIHTHFCTFKDDYKFLYDHWRDNPKIDRCWVPWDWCETNFIQRKNNSITIFAPDNDTMHAVKLDYDHCDYQRTQVYGNLWYPSSNTTSTPTWKDYVK